jgi:histidine ammonia-lyase
VDRLVNPAQNEGLPPFLAANPGLESGFMMAQVTAAALVAEIRVLATPASAGSITTSGDREDFVSMGLTAALKLKQVVRNTRLVLAIEALAASRAIDCLRPLKTSAALEAVCAALPPVRGDEPLTPHIERAEALIASGQLAVLAGLR